MSVIQNSWRFGLVLLLLASSSGYAKSVSDTAKEFYDLLKQKNYSAAAGYYDPAALSEFRNLMRFEDEIPDAARQRYYQTFFVPVLTDESIAKLSDLEFFVSFWRGILNSERFSGTITFNDVRILGVVMEGDSLAHVVIRNRISIGEHDVETVEVTTFGKIGGSWKVKMSGKLKVIALTLRWELTH